MKHNNGINHKTKISDKSAVRRTAILRAKDGESLSRIAASYGLNKSTICRWIKRAQNEGIENLNDRYGGGRKRSLNSTQEQIVFSWIVGGDPRQLQLDFGLWSRKIVAEQIKRFFNVKMSFSAVGNLLHRLGLTPQKPLRRAYEMNPEKIAEWKMKTLPEIKRKAKQEKAKVLYLDEAGIRSDDPLGRTWGIKGITPIVSTPGKRESLNLISAVGENGEFWYQVYEERLNSQKFIECLKNLKSRLKKKLFVILDGHPAHRSKDTIEWLKQTPAIKLFFLPPYAPDLNPDELVWHHLKENGIRKRPLAKGESLRSAVERDLSYISKNKDMLMRFVKSSCVA